MAIFEPLSIDLPQDTLAELRAAVEQGDYPSIAELVQDALRDWRTRRNIEAAELRGLVQDGTDSGPGLHADEVFGRLRAKFGISPAS